MARTGQDLSIYRGEQLSVRVPFTDEDGAAITLTAGRFTLAPFGRSTREIASWKTGSTELSLVSIDGTDDGLQLTLTPAQTRALQAGRYHWKARGKPSSGSQIGAEGAFTVLESADAMEPAL